MPETSTVDIGSTARSDSKVTLPTNRQHCFGVSFENVSIYVRGVGEDLRSTCYSAVGSSIPFVTKASSKRAILHNVTGQVRPGEMLLVLGSPGSGCTSLLKVISNQHQEFEHIAGRIRYGSIKPQEAEKLRGHIVMNTEDDLHFPTLKVNQTIDFATSTRIPKSLPNNVLSRRDYISQTTEGVLGRLAIGHTKNTIVGNEAIRGISGGERKRVSLAEVMSTQANVQCWDNSTRGLDSSNAFDFARVLRTAANDGQKAIVATLYQAGNGIYSQFDKVLVLAEGREIYYGPGSEACGYFENIGFEYTPGANISDYLTSVVVPTERNVRSGYATKVPNSAEEFESIYKESSLFQRMNAEIGLSPESSSIEVHKQTAGRTSGKLKTSSLVSRRNTPYQTSFFNQVAICSRRGFQILWGNRASTILQLIAALIMALVSGSLFYNLPEDSTSVFPRPGALFIPIQFFAMSKMSETMASFMGRRIFSRHKRLAFNRPAAYAIAFYYFMVNFQRDAGKFFTSWLFLILCTLNFAGLFRMIGAWCKHFGLASQITGFMAMVYMVYTGYLVPVSDMRPWFRWITWLNPATYTMQALIANELGDTTLTCVEPQFIPYGPGYENDHYRGCTVKGSALGSSIIAGSEYIQDEYLSYKSEIWRNCGILISLWFFFSSMTAIGFEINIHADAGSTILFKSGHGKRPRKKIADPEQVIGANDGSIDAVQIHSRKTVFTFEDISYFVHHEGKELQLLNKVSGYVKPGQLVALMGSSGAGKTTLMDVLAQRKDAGRIKGSILVNGKPQGITFQRTTGYCEQNDVHEPTATVWESLLFSARLRQNHNIPDEEKQAYVRSIMNLLELTPLQHAIVGSPGMGLSIEQRKRLTLATELVAQPSLLFLDEPMSGLDGQSAFEICRFLRKLAAAGQSIICTIHQPSATLFNAFDVLLLLGPGGTTTYFGPTSEDSATVIDYFTRNGAPPFCLDANPAEFIVDVVQGRFGADINWPQTWLDSPERHIVKSELKALKYTDGSGRITAPHVTNDEDDDQSSFATPIYYQVKVVTHRQLIALWRNPEYVWNKIGIHVTNGLFGGFTFWKLGNTVFDLQLRLMAVFNFLFVAPGCIYQLQPLFIHNRDIFETREKKAKSYHWFAFVAAQLLSEIPVLIVCGSLAFVTWYFSVGFPLQASASGQVYLQMLLYEFLYTSIGQAIAAYSPNAFFAAVANPIVLSAALINFCGVIVPYPQIQPFWRYWLYYLNPFTYLIQGLLQPVIWNAQVECAPDELTYIPLPPSTTCGDYIEDFLASHAGYVVDPNNSTMCTFCPYRTGAEYLKTMNINDSSYGWRGVGITALFCATSYALVFLMMKLRTKATKAAN